MIRYADTFQSFNNVAAADFFSRFIDSSIKSSDTKYIHRSLSMIMRYEAKF
jgi:hypothetical protein